MLRLNREALKDLTVDDLRKVAGGPMHTESCHLA
jgi:hypothetical protein